MSDIDWSKHTSHEIRKAMGSAPKVAGPWTKLGRTTWSRKPANGLWGAEVDDFRELGPESSLATAGGTGIMYCVLGGERFFVASVEDGKAKADAAIVAAGWLLDDEED